MKMIDMISTEKFHNSVVSFVNDAYVKNKDLIIFNFDEKDREVKYNKLDLYRMNMWFIKSLVDTIEMACLLEAPKGENKKDAKKKIREIFS